MQAEERRGVENSKIIAQNEAGKIAGGERAVQGRDNTTRMHPKI